MRTDLCTDVCMHMCMDKRMGISTCSEPVPVYQRRIDECASSQQRYARLSAWERRHALCGGGDVLGVRTCLLLMVGCTGDPHLHR